MSQRQWLENVRMAMNYELREISLMAQLAEQLPSAATRMEILGKIAEEAREAAFWNTVYACHSDMQAGYGPGYGPDYSYGPGYGPGYGPDYYGPGMGPDIYEAQKEKKKDE